MNKTEVFTATYIYVIFNTMRFYFFNKKIKLHAINKNEEVLIELAKKSLI